MSFDAIYERISGRINSGLRVGDGMGEVMRNVITSIALEMDYQESQREKLMEMTHDRVSKLIEALNKVAGQPGVEILWEWQRELEDMLFQSGKQGWPQPRSLAKTTEPDDL